MVNLHILPTDKLFFIILKERKRKRGGGRGLREERRQHCLGIPCSVQQAAVTDMLEPALENKERGFVH